jgi:uncharacterized membrane protein YccC
MKRLSLADFKMKNADMRHGLQLAIAVTASYLASLAVGLPEGFWAVMSALIVTRPDAGATIGAGWDRIRGTLLGTVFGIVGVWLRHTGLGVPTVTLLVVALLSFGSAGVPILRSAPMTALIILSSGGIAGHSPMQVAGLRVAEITIGVTVGLLISVAWPAARAATRFNAECAAVLRRAAAQVAQALADVPRTEAERDAASTDMRAALRRLVMLGNSAGQESLLSMRRGWHRLRGQADDQASKLPSHERIAKLVMRTSQDAALLGRVFDSQARDDGDKPVDPLWPELRDAACAALESVAGALASNRRTDLAALRRIEATLAERRADASKPDDVALLLAGPMRWLLDDLRSLGRFAAASATANAAQTA